MSQANEQAQLGEFVRSSLGKPDLGDHDDIFEVGEATSLYSMELVLFIEEKLGVPLDDEDLVRENFATLDAMCKMIDRKLDDA